MSRFTGWSMVLLVTVLCIVPTGLGQTTPAPAPELDCTDSLTDLLPCLDYVTNSSPNISAECCSGLGAVKASAPLCLCSFLNSNQSASLGINVTRALELPTFCKIDANPADCNGAATPTTAPVPSAAPPTAIPSPSTTPAPATTPSTAPSTAPTVAPAVSPVKAPTVSPPAAVLPPPPAQDCSSTLAELTPCLSFVTGQADPPPSSECCTKLSGVVATSPTCLCTLLEGSVPGLNATLALQLPMYCSVEVNPENCPGGVSPTPVSGPSAPTPGNPASALSFSPFLTIVLVAVAALQLLQ